MTINGTNITTWSAVQHHIDIGHHEVNRDSQWIRSAILPHFGAGYIGFKTLDVDMLVYGDNREQIIGKTSNLLAVLQDGPVSLDLDDYTHNFEVVLKSYKVSEFVMRRVHKVSLSFIGYEYGAEILATGRGSVALTNPGNILSPAKLEITPSANRTNVTVQGLCRDPRTGADLPVTLETVTQGVVITLDGANGLFKEGNNLKADLDIKSMPGFVHGAATVSCSDSAAVMSLTVLPLYM